MHARALIALTLTIGCAGRSEQASIDTTASGASSGAVASASSGMTTGAAVRPSPDTVAGQEVYIDSVRGTNPVTVFGRARTFENTVQVRLRDGNGRLIAERFTTSDGEMGHHNPFSREIWIIRDPGSRIIVEAFEYSAKDGSVRSLTGDTLPHRAGSMQISLAYPTSDCTVLATFKRTVPRTVAVARLLVEALVEGPTEAEQRSGARSPFPRGAAVNRVILRGGEITVDFNERLQNVGGSCAAQGIRAAVTQTLRALPGVTSVVITAGGSRDLALQP